MDKPKLDATDYRFLNDPYEKYKEFRARRRGLGRRAVRNPLGVQPQAGDRGQRAQGRVPEAGQRPHWQQRAARSPWPTT